MIKSRRRWADHVAHMGRGEGIHGFGWESEGKSYVDDLGVDGRILLKQIFKQNGGVVWIEVAEDSLAVAIAINSRFSVFVFPVGRRITLVGQCVMKFFFPRLFQWLINDYFRWTRTRGHSGLPAVFPRPSGVGLSSRCAPGSRETRRYRKRLQRMCQSGFELRRSTDIPRRTEILSSAFLRGRRGAAAAGEVFPQSGRPGRFVRRSGCCKNRLHEAGSLLNLRPRGATKRRCCI
jgi:hypothetical protein